MATPSSALWLLVVVASVMSQGCCQHWSYGLSPGGKRDLGLDLPDTLDMVVEGFPLAETPCGVLGCAEEPPPFPRMYRRKGFIVAAERENGHRRSKK
uniref:Gonadoliberin n=1 Tax=Mola mola TaxID=94237 RepID=A0A3Q3WHP1_MOLML